MPVRISIGTCLVTAAAVAWIVFASLDHLTASREPDPQPVFVVNTVVKPFVPPPPVPGPRLAAPLPPPPLTLPVAPPQPDILDGMKP